jgi:biopolymer transport protein ExbD
MSLFRNSKNRRKKKHSVEYNNDMDITSLLDVLVILVIFLIKTYSVSDFDIELAKDLNLAFSSSQELSRKFPSVQITNTKKVWVDGTEIGTFSSGNDVDKNLSLILLEKIKEFKPPAEINLILDKDLKYGFVQGIMDTCATTGFTKFRFVVGGSD